MIQVRFIWFSSDGADTEYQQLAYLHALPREGDRVDVMPALTNLDLPEEERQHVTNMLVTRVQSIAFEEGCGEGLAPRVYLERDPETVHQLELEAKERKLDVVRNSAHRVLEVLNVAALDVGVFDFESGGDSHTSSDLIVFHTWLLPESIPNWVKETADAVYVYIPASLPKDDNDRNPAGSDLVGPAKVRPRDFRNWPKVTCIKHRYQPFPRNVRG